MNRDWLLWCSLSGADPDDAARKMRFNTDPRVATLSRLPYQLVDDLAHQTWLEHPGCDQEDFLDQWFAAAQEATRPQREEAERQRKEAERQLRAQVEAAQRRQHAVERERRRVAHEARQRELAEESARRWTAAQRAAAIRDQVVFLYNITAIENVASIVTHGILSHDRAASIPHKDISDREVQRLRSGRKAADGVRLHGLASLYLNPRNAMLYRLVKEGKRLVVLRISPDILIQPGAQMSDGNAADKKSKFWPIADEAAKLRLDLIYSKKWVNDERTPDDELKRVTQAEILVPGVVPAHFITSFIVPSQDDYNKVRLVAPHLRGDIDPRLFFVE